MFRKSWVQTNQSNHRYQTQEWPSRVYISRARDPEPKKEFHWMLLKGHFWIIKFQWILNFRGKFFKFSFILFHGLRVSKDGLFLKWFVWRTSTNRYLHCSLNTSKLDFYLYLSPLRSIRSYHRAYLEQLSLRRFKIQGLSLHERIV